MKSEIAFAGFQKITPRWNTDIFAPNDRLIPQTRLYFPCKGEGYVKTASGSYHLTPGKMLLIPAYAIIHVSCPEYMEKYWSHFNFFMDDLKHDFFLMFHEPMEYTMQEGEFNYFKQLFSRLCDFFEDKEKLSPALKNEFLNSCLTMLLEPFLKEHQGEAQNSDSPSIINLLTIMQKNKFQDLSIEELSRRSGLSVNYIFRTFREKMNCSPLHYMKQQRLLRASLMLAHYGSMTVSEIAEECGYAATAAFSKAFRQQYKTAPREYRKEINKGALIK